MRWVEPAKPYGCAYNELKWVPKRGALFSYNRQHTHRPRHQTCHIHIAHRDTSLASQEISLPTLAKPCPSQGSQPASPQLPQVLQALLAHFFRPVPFPMGKLLLLNNPGGTLAHLTYQVPCNPTPSRVYRRPGLMAAGHICAHTDLSLPFAEGFALS